MWFINVCCHRAGGGEEKAGGEREAGAKESEGSGEASARGGEKASAKQHTYIHSTTFELIENDDLHRERKERELAAKRAKASSAKEERGGKEGRQNKNGEIRFEKKKRNTSKRSAGRGQRSPGHLLGYPP